LHVANLIQNRENDKSNLTRPVQNRENNKSNLTRPNRENNKFNLTRPVQNRENNKSKRTQSFRWLLIGISHQNWLVSIPWICHFLDCELVVLVWICYFLDSELVVLVWTCHFLDILEQDFQNKCKIDVKYDCNAHYGVHTFLLISGIY
ncbi:hypothetical protein DERF_010114, partial [Dermatophagoides farinae]